MWNTIRNFQNIFENQGILFSRMDKKRNRKKKRQTLQNEGFFVQKSGEDRKTGDAKVDKKNSENHRNHKEGQNEQDKMCPPKKIKQREQSEKWWKRRWKKKEERNIQEEDANQGRETRRERKRKGEKRDTKRGVFLQEKKRENHFTKRSKNKECKHIVSKREETFFFAHE